MAALRVVNDPARRLVAYVRVSTVAGRSGERFHSPDMQLNEMRALAARRDLREVAVVQDIDRTGRDFSREGVQQVMDMARRGQVDVVAVYDLSRFGRNAGESLRYISELRELGVSIISTTEQIDDSPEGQFMLGQFLGMAQLYSDQIGRRWAQIHERRHSLGKFHARVPLGYLNEDGRAVVDPLLGPLITWAFRSYLSGTASQRQIAARLTAARGQLVRQGTVANLLRNPFHAGEVMYQRRRGPGEHEPLIDRETFDAVQRKLARDIDLAPRVRVPVSCLAGLVRCGTCDQALHRRGRGKQTVEGVYRPRLRCPTTGCAGVGAPFVDDVEAAVLVHVLALADSLTDNTPAEQARRAKARKIDADTARLRKQLETVRRKLDKAAEKVAAEVMSDDVYRRLEARSLQEIAGLEQAIGDATDSPARLPATALASAAARLRSRWEVMTAQERRAVLLLFMDQVWLDAAAYRGQPVAERLRFPDL